MFCFNHFISRCCRFSDFYLNYEFLSLLAIKCSCDLITNLWERSDYELNKYKKNEKGRAHACW